MSGRWSTAQRATQQATPAAVSRWNVAPIDTSTGPAAAAAEPAPTPAPPGIFVPRPTGDTTPVVTWRPGGRHLFTWVGAHGGAGATSMACGSGQGAELTKAWPSTELGWPVPAVIVCRSNTAGLDAAARLIQEASSGHIDQVENIDVIALTVTADSPGRLPKMLRHRLHELSGLVQTVLEVPWIGQWRETPYTPDPVVVSIAERISQEIQQRTQTQS